MQATVLERIAPIEESPLRLEVRPVPEPCDGEVLLKVRCCGICRTDLHVIEGELPRQKLPIIPGHQVVGIVEALGPGCKRLAQGQRIGAAWLRHTCGTCVFCNAGQENLCEASRFTGYHADGGYAEYAVVPEDYAYIIPDAFDDVEAAPLLCAGIIGYRALKRANLPSGGTLAIFGFGSSAHVVFQIAKHRGATVYVVSRGGKHLELAREMGADWVSDRVEDMPQKVDSAIIFAPAGHLVPPALETVRKGGTLALAGVYMTDVPAMNYEKHLFYERDLRSVTANCRQDGRELLAEAAEIPIRPHTTTYPLAEANRALQDLKADQINGSGVLVVEA
ncbi:MAG TPA: zinc-dependent alcohol dehydrogenase family protein [Candidatus Hydrogenedentes bacterium]|nr:zinc-dependent alcohol dehydrogenase family protein [Candidatus Hydrogenedentota bacterium]